MIPIKMYQKCSEKEEVSGTAEAYLTESLARGKILEKIKYVDDNQNSHTSLK